MISSKIKLITWVAVLLILSETCLIAQLPDGTITTSEWLNEIQSNLEEETDPLYNTASVYHAARLSLAVHIVRDIGGNDNCSESDIAAAIGNLNHYFGTIKLDFMLSPVHYINDFNYSYIQDEEDTYELVQNHSVDRTINLYLVESVRIDSVQCYGFTYFPADTVRNYIFLDKKMIQGNYLTTLMGHYLGLLSTHDTLGGFERVDESNCASGGDFICDTWADPNLFGLVDTVCEYTGNRVDVTGEFFVPSVANLMSESYDACKCIFTSEQYRRMLFCLKRYRHYLR